MLRQNVQKHRTIFSACKTYRYALRRQWDATNPAYALFIGLNPSTADEVNDDPTIRRCIDFARRWGYGSLCVANLFAFRATKPTELKTALSPVGPRNNFWLKRLATNAHITIAAWGNHGSFSGRDRAVIRLVNNDLSCLGLTKHGQPRHPLYVRRKSTVQTWLPANLD